MMTGSICAYAVFTPCQQSHPFDDRRVPFGNESVKIGRAVAKLRPALDNAIFDCKVLSRNHAVIWYEDGKFYLKDTKSSNGTFVNNQRLSKGSEESPPKEVFSGDIIQFGVDIVENTKKVTHGCIVAMVRLYYPDGQEGAPRSDFDVVHPQSSSPVSCSLVSSIPACTGLNSQELYQLQQYIKEAVYREQLIESKLSTLQNLLCSTQEASENSWQALIDEDRLLSRIEMLEGQLLAYSKNASEDKLREQIHQMREEKERYELAGKEALRRALQEKMEAVQRLADVERSLETTEEECSHLRESCDSAHKELRNLAHLHTEAMLRVQNLSVQLEDAETKYRDLEQRVSAEKIDLETKLTEMSRQESILTAKIETLQADHDFAKEQLAAMKIRSYLLQTSSPDWRDNENNENRQFLSPNNDVVCSNDFSSPQNQTGGERNVVELSEALNAAQVEVQLYRQQLHDSRIELDKSKQKVTELNTELNRARQDLATNNMRVSTLEDFIKTSDDRLHSVVEQATSDMILHFDDVVYQKRRNEDFVSYLKEATSQMENKIKGLLYKGLEMSNGSSPSSPSSVKKFNGLGLPNGHCAADMNGLNGDYSSDDIMMNDGEDDCSFHNQLARAVQAQRLAETELIKYKEELDHNRFLRERAVEENQKLMRQLQSYENRLSETCAQVDRLREQLTKEQEKCQRVNEEVGQLKVHLEESQRQAQLSRSETEQLTSKLKLLSEDLEFERSLRTTSSLDNDNARIALHRQAAKNAAEFASLKDECANLRQRIMAIESEIKSSRKENSRLSSEYKRLQESYRQLEETKGVLESNENSWKFQLDGAKYDADLLRNQLNEAQEEVMELRKSKLEQEKEIKSLKCKLDKTGYDFNWEDLALQTRTIAICSAIPLFVLFIALLLAFLPFFSSITATNDTFDGNIGQQ